uniref:Uncharacterized protein n=1 Tax=viral metagenome TaxID=1070528 RepID=A0A6C0KF48_9ZZZZ
MGNCCTNYITQDDERVDFDKIINEYNSSHPVHLEPGTHVTTEPDISLVQVPPQNVTPLEFAQITPPPEKSQDVEPGEPYRYPIRRQNHIVTPDWKK